MAGQLQAAARNRLNSQFDLGERGEGEWEGTGRIRSGMGYGTYRQGKMKPYSTGCPYNSYRSRIQERLESADAHTAD
jgi:hypothetical protein